MVQLPRPRRSLFGRFRPGPLVRGWLLACPLAAALACAPSKPVEAPESAAPSEGEPGEPIEPGAAEPGSEPSPSAEGEPAADSPASSPAAAAGAPRDTRGKAEIQQVMANHRDKVRACYDAALAENPGIKGDLVVDFTIDPRGDVKHAEVNWSQSEIHIPELDTCAAEAVRSLKFPPSSRGLESKVSYPFNFNPPRESPPAQGPSGPEPSRSGSSRD